MKFTLPILLLAEGSLAGYDQYTINYYIPTEPTPTEPSNWEIAQQAVSFGTETMSNIVAKADVFVGTSVQIGAIFVMLLVIYAFVTIGRWL